METNMKLFFGWSARWVTDRKPILLEFRSSKAFITFVVAYAVFADQFIFAIIVPVLPFTLYSQIGVPESSVQYWISVLLTVFGAATAVASPVWGWYTDRISSRQVPFFAGLFAISGATIMIWRGRTIALQIIGRILQGLSSAIIWVTGLAMIADTVDPRELGQYVGYLGIAMMVGTLIAPLIGGIVLAKAGYNAVFIITLGILGLDVFLRLVIIEKKMARHWVPEPDSVEMFPSKGVRPELTAGSEDSSMETTPKEGQGTTSHGDEMRMKTTRVPAVLGLLSSRRLLAALWGSVMVGAIFAGLESVLPLQTQAAFGWNSIGGGLIFLPLTIPAFLGPQVGWVCDRYGSRLPVLAGFLVLCPCLTLLLLVNHNSIEQKVLLSALLTLIGCCFTLTLDPLITEVGNVVEYKSKTRYGTASKAYAQAFGLFNMAYSIGNTVGPLCAGLIRDKAGWATMSWVLGLLSGVTAIPVGLWCNGWIWK